MQILRSGQAGKSGDSPRLWKLGATAAVAVASVVLGGCVVAPAGPAYHNGAYYEPAYGGEVVTATIAPPVAYVETVPVAPFMGALWIGGFWDWEGGRHVWRAGHYEHPRPGYAYHQPQWQHGPNGQWQLHRGGWARGPEHGERR